MKYEDQTPTIADQEKSIRRLKLTIETLKRTHSPIELIKTYEAVLKKAEKRRSIANERAERSRKAARAKYER